MKRSLTLLCLLASSAAFAQAPSAPTPADSTTGTGAPSTVPATPKIAYIQFQQAVAATNEGQRNFAQLRTKFEPKQTQLKTQNDEIDSLKKQLQDAGANLSETERDSRLRTIDEKTKSLQRSAEDAQNEASTAMNDMYQQLAQKVYAVLDSYSNANKFSMVLDTSAQQTPVLWASPALTSPKRSWTRTTSSLAFRRSRHPAPRTADRHNATLHHPAAQHPQATAVKPHPQPLPERVNIAGEGVVSSLWEKMWISGECSFFASR